MNIGKKWNCDDNYWDAIFSEHTIEHITYKAAITCFAESYRTLKKGGLLRLSIPNIELYIQHFSGEHTHDEFNQFETNAEGISYVTQNFGHKSVWSPLLLIALLKEIGFSEVLEKKFCMSNNNEICVEQKYKEWESMYVEATK